MSRLAIFVIFSILHGHIAVAQQASFIHYDTRDGLAQSQVRAIGQDNRGLMWFGTLGGMSRFDGYVFQNFSSSDGLPSNQINCFLQGKSQFWIGSTGAICSTGGTSFISVPFPEKFSKSHVSDMVEDANGHLWLALSGDGLLKYDGNKFSHFGRQQGLPDEYLRSIALDAKGKLWIGSRAGISLMENDEIIDQPFRMLDSLSVSDILFTKNGNGIICTFGDGVFIIEKGKIEQLTSSDGLASNNIRCVLEMTDGQLWFGAKEGLSNLKSGKLKIFREEQGLPYSNIKSLSTDREGNLWIGTDGKGALLQAGISFMSLSAADGMHSDLILSICKSDTGSLVFGSYDNGIALYNGKKFEAYALSHELPNSTVWSLEITSDGSLWAGTSGGLFIENKGVIKVLKSADGITGDRITALEPVGNNMWAGTENGIALISNSGRVLQKYDGTEGFAGKRIRSIKQINDALWIGAEGRLYRYSEEGFKWKAVDKNEENPVYCISSDGLGYVWVGTSGGLFKIDSDWGELTEVQFGNNFSSRNVNFLQSLPDSTMLIGTNDGLFRLNVAAFHDSGSVEVSHYTDYEGLKGTETNQNAVLKDGEVVWFGTTSGAVKFEPFKSKATEPTAPELILNGVQLFLQETNWGNIADSISPKTGLPENPLLSHNQNYLTFDYSGLHYSNPEKVLYRYKLVGADDKWLGPTKNRSVTYAYLPHGNYMFSLETFTEDHPNLVTSLTFPFEVRPPFYLTFWFFALLALAILGIFYAIYLQQIKKEEEKRNNMQRDFQARLSELETQTLNSNMNRHFIFNALNSIQYYINVQDRKSANRYLTSFAKLIRKNLDSSQKNETSLKDELERLELYLSLEKMRFQGRFEYFIVIEYDIDPEQVDIPAMMLQPFLENSIWHGILPTQKQGEINVRIFEVNNEIHIAITDNGIGIEASRKKKALSNDGHISKGMDITHDRMQVYRKLTGLNYRVEGPYEIKNTDGVIDGTQVDIILPKSVNRNFYSVSPQVILES